MTDAEAFPREELVQLYHRRWRIETIYREWKHTLNIQNLRSHSRVGILKELYAHLLLNNLVRWVMTLAAQGTQHTAVELSFTAAVQAVHTAIVCLICAPRRAWRHIMAELLAEIRAASIRSRPGRSYPRPGDGLVKNKGRGRYRLPARIRA